MDSSMRAELIRKGNQAFNAGDYALARDCFSKAQYASGLVRIGDHYMYDRRLPLLAYGYYKRAGAEDKVQDLQRRMVGALGTWIGHDKIKTESLIELGMAGNANQEVVQPVATEPDADGMIPVAVAPELREMAFQILNKSNN